MTDLDMQIEDEHDFWIENAFSLPDGTVINKGYYENSIAYEDKSLSTGPIIGTVCAPAWLWEE